MANTNTTKASTKATKGNKAKAKAAPVPAVPAALPVPAATLQATSNGATKATWQGYTVSALLRALGYAGYTVKQGAALLAAVGVPTSPSTVGCQLGAGRQYARGVAQPHHQGGITPLAGQTLALVVQLVGQPALPHATVAALPTKPAVVAAVPVAQPAAPVTVTVPNGKGGKVAVAVTPAVAAVLAPKGRKGRK